MWKYDVDISWSGGRSGRIERDEFPPLTVSSPEAFGGEKGEWDPESLLAASVGSCILTTVLFFVGRLEADVRSIRIGTTARMEKTAAGLAITGVEMKVTAVVGQQADVGKMKKILRLAEDNCPISRALNCPVDIGLEVSTAD